ncbi:Transcription elongation factor spt6 [Neolecta irregularis DAH-3]|uniref:Transcription elongation factor Spt6 n=1 Tax=Neolecta irregularis (strain DAH-3) TaxID=1198029 RepID=A0A1U7LUL0_NEOID|nr:Transcription elongation factor spt6 [Neolecta irregularis DAH-3]|eukprot:OLL26201.1 Transcription elongation factor spt6 [Neolecta irregularis DAH-3]
MADFLDERTIEDATDLDAPADEEAGDDDSPQVQNHYSNGDTLEEDDSSEEEEEDEEAERKVREGFIVDDEEDEDESTRRRHKKRRKRKIEVEGPDPDELDEDDLDLIGLGRPAEKPRDRQLKRLKRRRDDHDKDEPPNPSRGLEDIFSDDEEQGDYGNLPEAGNSGMSTNRSRYQETGPGHEFDDFIEDDELTDDDDHQRPRQIRQERVRVSYPGMADVPDDVQMEMGEVFGDGGEYAWAEEEDEHGLEHKVQKGLQLKDIFEPSELQERMLTEEDELYRVTDIPERFQVLHMHHKLQHFTDSELEGEGRWIADVLSIRKRDSIHPDHQDAFKQAVIHVVTFLNQDNLDIPYIWHHKRDYLYHIDRTQGVENLIKTLLIDQDDLWRILEMSAKFKIMEEKKSGLLKLYTEIGKVDMNFEDFLEKAAGIEDFQDLHDYIHFRYSQIIRDVSINSGLKKPSGKHAVYERIRNGHIYNIVKAFGITAEQYGINFQDEIKRYSPDDPYDEPLAVAVSFSCDEREEDSLSAARMMLAEEIVNDLAVRKRMRMVFFTQGSINVHPTDRGIRKIDESHPYYKFKYLRNLLFTTLLEQEDPSFFVQMLKAEEDGLVTVEIEIRNYEDFFRRSLEYIESDNYSELADKWNRQRRMVLETAFSKLRPNIERLVKENLKSECEDNLASICRRKLLGKIDVMPLKPDELKEGESPRILALTNGQGDISRDPVIAVYVDEKGRAIEELSIGDLRNPDSQAALLEMVDHHKPEFVGIAGFSVGATRMHDDLTATLQGKPPVVWVNDEVARLYHVSQRAAAELPDLTLMGRYCVALARYLQSPLLEYISLGSDLVNIPFHQWQKLLPEAKLQNSLDSAIVDVVNMVGVDINEAISNSYKAAALQYVSGLGRRKTNNMINKINISGRLTSRPELITRSIVAAKIFLNCASFLKIPYEGRFVSENVEILDSTRIHPQDYELAKKMAADALELDEEDIEEYSGSGGVAAQLMLQDDPAKLDELVLDEYADELERVLSEPKRATLVTIREELKDPYRELRKERRDLSDIDRFTMLTGETLQTLREDTLVPVNIKTVTPNSLAVLLDCGVEGEIEYQKMSDQHGFKPFDLFQAGETVQARILSLDRVHFRAELSTRESDIKQNRDNRQHGHLDWDDFAEERDKSRLSTKREAEQRIARVIKHPLFRPFNARQAETFLNGMQRGDAVIRPSSNGPDHIAVTWKVTDHVYQHIDVLELDKDNDFSVGKTLKIAHRYTYSDLDELIVSHIKTMARKIDQMTEHEKFQKGTREDVEQWLTKYAEANPKRSSYAFCFDREHPGYFQLCFKANQKSRVAEWVREAYLTLPFLTI